MNFVFYDNIQSVFDYIYIFAYEISVIVFCMQIKNTGHAFTLNSLNGDFFFYAKSFIFYFMHFVFMC